MIYENEITEVIRTSEGYLAKNKATGRYLKIGVREAKYLCSLLDSDALDAEEAPELDEEEKEYLKKAYDDFGLTGKEPVETKRHMSDKILFVFGKNSAYCNLIKLCSHLVSRTGVILFIIAAVSAGICVNKYDDIYLDSLKAAADIIRPGSVIIFYGMFVISGFIHETAHISACFRFTGCIGMTGVKLYFCIPAFFADVNDIYRSDNKRHKIIVSLIGIISNIMLACISFAVVPFVSDKMRTYLVIFVAYNISAAIFNLIPFAKYDGYWIIQNISGVNNLYDRSMALFMILFTRPTSFIRSKEKNKIVMTIYGCMCYVFSLYLWYVFVRAVFTLTDTVGVGADTELIIRIWGILLAVYGCVTYTKKYLKKGMVYGEKVITD